MKPQSAWADRLRWPLCDRPSRRGAAPLVAAAGHAALLALLLAVRTQAIPDQPPPIAIQIVTEPAVAAAPPAQPLPPAAPAPAAVPDTPQVMPEQMEVAAADTPPPPSPAPTAPVEVPQPAAPLAPEGKQAELPLPAVPTPLAPTPVPSAALPVISPPPPPAAHPPPRPDKPPPHQQARARPREVHEPREQPRAAEAPASMAGTTSAHPEPAAPAATPPAPASGDRAAATWRDRLAAWLSARKSYPEAARAQDEEGTVVVRFTIAHDGRVLAVSLVRSSGHPLLDDATEAMLRGATAPALPPEMPQDQQTVTVPLRYSLMH